MTGRVTNKVARVFLPMLMAPFTAGISRLVSRPGRVRKLGVQTQSSQAMSTLAILKMVG